jgi:hypothetical protein
MKGRIQDEILTVILNDWETVADIIMGGGDSNGEALFGLRSATQHSKKHVLTTNASKARRLVNHLRCLRLGDLKVSNCDYIYIAKFTS